MRQRLTPKPKKMPLIAALLFVGFLVPFSGCNDLTSRNFFCDECSVRSNLLNAGTYVFQYIDCSDNIKSTGPIKVESGVEVTIQLCAKIIRISPVSTND
jgi:hypothetical protein